MSGTRTASIPVRPVGSALASRFGRYPIRRATAWTCSRVRSLTRSGSDRARETVDTATCASRATSCRVTARRRPRGPVMRTHPSTRCRVYQDWKVAANVCHTDEGHRAEDRDMATGRRTTADGGSVDGAAAPLPPARVGVLVWGVAMLGYVFAVLQRTTFGVAGLDAAER